MSHKYCELGQVQDAARGTHESLFSSELDSEMSGLENISKTVKHQLHLNVNLNLDVNIFLFKYSYILLLWRHLN